MGRGRHPAGRPVPGHASRARWAVCARLPAAGKASGRCFDAPEENEVFTGISSRGDAAPDTIECRIRRGAQPLDPATDRSSSEDRSHRPRLRWPAAGHGVRRGRRRGRRRRGRGLALRRGQRRPQLHPGRGQRGAQEDGRRRADPRDDRLRRDRGLRRRHHLPSDAAQRQPRARPHARHRRDREAGRRTCAAASWSRSRARRTRARRARSWRRSSSAALGSRPASTSTSRSRRSASTPGAPTTRPRARPRSSAASRRPARRARSRSTAPALDHVVPVSTPEAAEMTKLLENIFRSVNIALMNELAMLCDRMKVDIWEVIDAAATKPFGFMKFQPGPGLGGHCIPIDPFYLSWKAREFDFWTEFIELAGKVNENMPYFCVEKLHRALNTRGKSLNGAPRARPRRRLQGRHRRPARVAGAQGDPPAARARRRRGVPRPILRGAAPVRAAVGPARRLPRSRGLRRRGDRHRALRRWTTGPWSSEADLVVDFRNATAGVPSAGNVWKL